MFIMSENEDVKSLKEINRRKLDCFRNFKVSKNGIFFIKSEKEIFRNSAAEV